MKNLRSFSFIHLLPKISQKNNCKHFGRFLSYPFFMYTPIHISSHFVNNKQNETSIKFCKVLFSTQTLRIPFHANRSTSTSYMCLQHRTVSNFKCIQLFSIMNSM